MEKLGKVLLLTLNICIDIFLIVVFIILLLWAILDISPEKSVQNTFMWIQTSWDALWGITPKERTVQISPKLQDRAHRQIYMIAPNKRKKSSEDIIVQPYK